MCGRIDARRRSAVLRAVTALVLLLGLAVGAAFPLARLATSHIPLGTEPAGTVPLLNLWTLWWNVDRIEQGYESYWNAPIYHPVDGMLAAVEPQTIVGWMAWGFRQGGLQWGTLYNSLVLLFLAFNGFFAFRLLKRFRVAYVTSLCGGAMVTTLPLVYWQIGVFQLISLWGILWTFKTLVQFRDAPGPRRAVYLAVAFAATYSLCCYYGLMLSLLLLIGMIPLCGRRLLQWRFWCWGAVSLASVFLLLSPILTAQIRFGRQHWFAYPEHWICKLSAAPTDYLRTPWPQLLPLPDIDSEEGFYPWPLSPGALKSCIAFVGLVWGAWTRRRRRITLWLGICALAAMLLSMGPRLEIAQLSPYRWLADTYPGLGRARSVYRFAFFVQLAVALLAAIGLHGIYLFLKGRGLHRRRRWIATSSVLLLGGLMTGETWPAPPQMYRLPKRVAESAWVSYLSDEARRDACLAFFPLPVNNTASALQPTAEWMYFQTRHERSMVNGYSTFVPETFQQLKKTLAGFPHPEGVAALQDLDVTHIVVHRRFPTQIEPVEMQKLDMRCVFTDRDARMEIWRLPGESRVTGDVSATR